MTDDRPMSAAGKSRMKARVRVIALSRWMKAGNAEHEAAFETAWAAVEDKLIEADHASILADVIDECALVLVGT